MATCFTQSRVHAPLPPLPIGGLSDEIALTLDEVGNGVSCLQMTADICSSCSLKTP